MDFEGPGAPDCREAKAPGRYPDYPSSTAGLVVVLRGRPPDGRASCPGPRGLRVPRVRPVAARHAAGTHRDAPAALR